MEIPIKITKEINEDESIKLKFEFPEIVKTAIDWSSSKRLLPVAYQTTLLKGKRRCVFDGLYLMLENDEQGLFDVTFLKDYTLVIPYNRVTYTNSIITQLKTAVAKMMCWYDKYGTKVPRATRRAIARVDKGERNE